MAFLYCRWQITNESFHTLYYFNVIIMDHHTSKVILGRHGLVAVTHLHTYIVCLHNNITLNNNNSDYLHKVMLVSFIGHSGPTTPIFGHWAILAYPYRLLVVRAFWNAIGELFMVLTNQFAIFKFRRSGAAFPYLGLWGPNQVFDISWPQLITC